MADIKYIVECDASGALKSIKELDGAIGQAAKTTGQAGASGGPFSSLFGQFTAGVLVASALQKGIGALKDVVADAIRGAIEEERTENNLRAALELTGRTVEGNIQHYLGFSQAQAKSTLFTHEQVEASQALLLQLTNLDQNGIDRATKGAMGLASTMGIDLHSATMMVTKAMEGNYTALGRVGIKVNENLTAEQKQASLLDQLITLYGRSTKETETFGGSLTQLAKNWDEIKTEAGKAVIETEGLGEAIVGLNKAMSSFVASGAMKSWVQQLIMYTPILRHFVNGVEELAVLLQLEAVRAEHASKVNAGLGIAIDAVGKTFAKAAPMAKIFGVDFDALVKMFSSAPAKINQVGNNITALTKEEVEAAKKAVEAKKKLADAAQDLLNRYLPLLGETKKLKDEEDILTKAYKAGVMTAGPYKLAMDANAKAQRDVGVEAGKTAKAQGEMVKAAQDIINRYNPMHAAMVKAIDDERALASALKAGVITDKDYAKGLESIKKDLDAAAAAEKAAKTSTSAFASSIQDLVNQLKVTGPGFATATAGEKNLMAALVMGMISLKQYKKLLADLNKELKDKKGTDSWKDNAKSAVAAGCAAANVGITYIEGLNEQALQKKLTQLDTEYQAQLLLIQNSMMNEEEKAAAIEKLDATYASRRQAAEVQAGEQRKKTAIAQAIINTAQGVTLAWGQGGFLMGLIMAAIVAAAGAAQIALIRSQPIGAAKGAIFKEKALLMSQNTGQEYEVAEDGEAEIVSSPRQLREAIMGKAGIGGSAGRTISLTVPIYIGANLIKKEIITIVEEAGQLRRLRISGRAVA